MIFLISFTGAVCIYALIYICFCRHALQSDSIKSRMERISGIKERALVLDDDLDKPLSERIFKPILDNFLKQLKKLAPEDNKTSGTTNLKQEKLKARLRQAGIRMGANEYKALQTLIVMACAVLAGLVALIATSGMQAVLLAIFIGAYAGIAVPRFYFARKVKSRQETIQRQLAEVLDMLSVSVEAGLGMEQALVNVIEHFNGPLIDELSITYREISMGRTRRDAFLSLGERSDINEVKTFVRAFVQAGELGIPIRNVLTTQSQYIRQTRRNKIEEKAMKISVKILIPMAFFIFPVIFIVLLGPAMVSIMDTFF